MHDVEARNHPMWSGGPQGLRMDLEWQTREGGGAVIEQIGRDYSLLLPHYCSRQHVSSNPSMLFRSKYSQQSLFSSLFPNLSAYLTCFLPSGNTQTHFGAHRVWTWPSAFTIGVRRLTRRDREQLLPERSVGRSDGKGRVPLRRSVWFLCPSASLPWTFRVERVLLFPHAVNAAFWESNQELKINLNDFKN